MTRHLKTREQQRADIPSSRRIAKRLAYVVDDLSPSQHGVVVLAYHRVGGRTVSPVDLSTSAFRRQITHVRERVLTLDESIELLTSTHRRANADAGDNADTSGAVEASTNGAASNGQSAPPIVITFDDGTSDFAEVVLPILVEHQLPATLYLSTANVDTGTQYPSEGVPISWNELRDCLSTGLVTIGSHTHGHVLLDRCSPDTAAEQLAACDRRIEDELGVTPRHFAYPKAVAASGSIEAHIVRRYVTAAVAGTRPNRIGHTNLHRLSRSPIQNADGWQGFVRKAAGGMRVEDDVRRVLNLVRYRGKTS